MRRSIPMIAGGTIQPATFTKVSTAADLTVLAAGANARTFGVAVDAAKLAPTAANSGNMYAATTGDQLDVYLPGIECLLLLGSGGATAGDELKSDASGNGVTCGAYDSTTPQWVGATALQAGSAGDKIKVRVEGYWK